MRYFFQSVCKRGLLCSALVVGAEVFGVSAGSRGAARRCASVWNALTGGYLLLEAVFIGATFVAFSTEHRLIRMQQIPTAFKFG